MTYISYADCFVNSIICDVYYITVFSDMVSWSFACFAVRNAVSPSTRYELLDGTVLECVLPADGEKLELVSALLPNIAVHTDLLPNVYEG